MLASQSYETILPSASANGPRGAGGFTPPRSRRKEERCNSTSLKSTELPGSVRARKNRPDANNAKVVVRAERFSSKNPVKNVLENHRLTGGFTERSEEARPRRTVHCSCNPGLSLL